MSLSAPEKVRVVQALDALGVHFIEAGFPSSNPKEVELFELLAELELAQATICAFGMTRRRGRRRRGRPGAARPWSSCFAPVVDAGRQDLGAAPREGDQGLPRGEPGDDRRLGRLLPRARASASSTTPSTSSTATATTPPTRSSACSAAVGAGAENVTLCDTNGASLPDQVADGDRGRSSPTLRGWRSRSASTSTTTPSAASPTRWPRSREGARLVQGTSQRLRRALRQRQPGLDPAGAAAEDGLRGGHRRSSSRRLTETAHFIDELCNVTPDPDQPYVGRNAFAHKGGMHVAGVAADARTFEHIEPAAVGNERDDPRPRSCPARRRSAARPSRPGSSSTTRRPRGRSSG